MSWDSQPTIAKLIWCKDIDGHIEPVEYLIHKLLQMNCKAAMVANFASYKTFVALSFAIAIARGDDWFGRKATQRPVLYIVGEHVQGVLRRIKGAVGVSDIPLVIYPEPIRMLDTFNPLPKQAGIQPKEMDEPVKIKALCLEIEKVTGKKPFVIIDTLNRNFGSGDESSTSDMTVFTNKLDDYVFPFSSGFLVVHHTPKAGNSSRGSNVLPGYIDTEITLKGHTDLSAVMTFTKTKDDASPGNIDLRFKIVDTGLTPVEGEPVTTLVLESVKMGGKVETGKLTNKDSVKA
ncbi:MAG: AAA family ATPase, partial [Desulfobulbaceae bacterium]|nr:AAA family ATPase [Desulfobulbaceae bacterium]